ncbi:MAG TPA: DUF5916 domain-containing protein [Candidatus Eremiobacteraceae bacterium]
MRLNFLVLATAIALALPSAAAADGLPALSIPLEAQTPAMGGEIDASWSTAAKLTLDNDFTYRHPATEPTAVFVAQDKSAIDIGFVVTQKESLTEAQETNGPGVANDDNVTVYLFPQGVGGFAYSFSANPRGARYQTSTENTAYSPQWIATSKITPTGYSVTMRIPFSLMRAGGSTVWRAEFARTTIVTGSTAIWAFTPGQRSVSDPSYAGTLRDIAQHVQTAAAPVRPQPRLQLYSLGEVTTRAQGGDTSRVGADLSIPITPTASFVSTLHPDYSNVEVDQQTIAPNAFQRQFNEVRPFFTQLTQYYNFAIGCIGCPQSLYTPIIPTFRDGYAIEGTQGALSFSSYDTTGFARNDQATALNYFVKGPSSKYGLDIQQVGVDQPGFHDIVDTFTTGYVSKRSNLFVYANGGQDRGTNVTAPNLGNYDEIGTGYASPITVASLSYQSVGAQYLPADGFVAQSDTAGLETTLTRNWNFSPTALVHDMTYSWYGTHFRSHTGELDQTSAAHTFTFDFRGQLRLNVFTGSSDILVTSNQLLPFNTNGVYLGYKAATTTPSFVQHLAGAYYHGSLDNWTYLTTQPLARDIHVTFEADENQYTTVYPGEKSGRQWLERATLDWQLNRNASFDLGVRRLIGPNLPVSFAPPDFTPLNAANVSVAFHFLTSKNEFYAVYGDPNSLSTKPALFLKWIRYIGAEKGT